MTEGLPSVAGPYRVTGGEMGRTAHPARLADRVFSV